MSIPQKGIEGSNPSVSAINSLKSLNFYFLRIVPGEDQGGQSAIDPDPLQLIDRWDEQVGERQTDCEWQQDPMQQHQHYRHENGDRDPERGGAGNRLCVPPGR
jgi:hypothetical protein